MQRALYAIAILALLATACGDDDSTGQNNNNNNNNSVPPDCGDGNVDPGEQCDEGSANSDTQPDACRTNCYEAFCGDGVIDNGETCDDDTDNSDTEPDACRTTCALASCGDETLDTGEVCDDGNTTDGDGCSADCSTTEACGNGTLDSGFGEECDCGLDPANLPQDCYTTNDHINSFCITGCQDFCVRSHVFDVADAGDGIALAVDASGNFAMTGQFVGHIDLGGGQLGSGAFTPRAYVAKFDSSGNHLWSIWLRNEVFPNIGESEGRGVAFDSQGDLYIMGSFTDSITLGSSQLPSYGSKGTYVAKLDGATGAITNSTWVGYHPGTLGWYPDGFRLGWGIDIDGNDDLVVSGEYDGSWGCLMGPCTQIVGRNPFVVKLGSALNTLWTHRPYDNNNTLFDDDVAAIVTFDPAGDVYIAGQFNDTLIFSGGSQLYTGTPVQSFAYVAKLAGANGATEWIKMLGTQDVNGLHGATGLTTLSTGDVVVSGAYLGTLTLAPAEHETNSLAFHGFMAAYDGNGNYLWHDVVGTDWAWTFGATRDVNDNLAFVGSFDSTIDFGDGEQSTGGARSTFLARYDAQGNPLGSRVFGFTDVAFGMAIAADPTGRLVISGYTSSDVDFGCGLYTHTGPEGVPFVALLNAF